MLYFSKKEFDRKMKKVKRRNETIMRQNMIRSELEKVTSTKKKIPTDKLIALYLFIVLNVILIYAMVVMWKFADLSSLGILITDMAGQVITYYIYAKKATAQNTVGGITYDLAMLEHNMEVQENGTDS